MKKKSNNVSRKNNDELDIPLMSRAEMRRGVMGKYAHSTDIAHRFVELDGDVAQIFKSSKSVNTVLRGIIQGLSASQKQKKSA
jgi:hypothetical protein